MAGMKIKISRWALQDIQEATDWYNQQVPGLGKRFQNQVKKQMASLTTTALHHTVPYEDVRCNRVKIFPFNIHFTVSKNKCSGFCSHTYQP